MRRALAACVAAGLLVAACSSDGPSKSYRLGQFDGAHRITTTASDVSPAGIGSACQTQLSAYMAKASFQRSVQALPANRAIDSKSPELTAVLDEVSTPTFTIHARDINRTDYMAGCKSALRKSLGG